MFNERAKFGGLNGVDSAVNGRHTVEQIVDAVRHFVERDRGVSKIVVCWRQDRVRKGWLYRQPVLAWVGKFLGAGMRRSRSSCRVSACASWGAPLNGPSAVNRRERRTKRPNRWGGIFSRVALQCPGLAGGCRGRAY